MREDTILAAYHRAAARHRARTGVRYPILRASCVLDDGTITDTDVQTPKVLARWTLDVLGRPRVQLA